MIVSTTGIEGKQILELDLVMSLVDDQQLRR